MATQAQNLSREVAHACLTGTGPLRTKEFTFFAHFPELFDLFFEVFPRFLQNSRVFHVFHTPFCSPKPPKYPTLPPPAPLSPCTLHAPAPAAAGAHKPLHLSRTLYKSALFMQNKPNFHAALMNLTPVKKCCYENNRVRQREVQRKVFS